MSSNRKKHTGPEEVAKFMNNLDHPLKREIEEVRSIILCANPQITEHIKWNAPSFCYRNEDRITFNLRGKGFFQLIFHCGAKVREGRGDEPMFDDQTGLLEWAAGDRGIVKISDMDDVNAKREKLTVLVNRWIEAAAL